MIALAMGTVFASYSAGILAYCWLRGYSVTFTELFHSTWPGGQPSSAGAASKATSTSEAAGGPFPTPSGQSTDLGDQLGAN
jgi:hypothetical protein